MHPRRISNSKSLTNILVSEANWQYMESMRMEAESNSRVINRIIDAARIAEKWEQATKQKEEGK